MPPTRAPHLSIVIPAFREEAKIADDIRAAAAFLRDDLDGDGEVVVVDDGSPDATAARSLALAPEVPQLRVLTSARNRGKGHALRSGVAVTRGRYVLFADAGGCVPFADALVGLALLEAGADVAHGSRRAPGAAVTAAAPLHRRLGSRAFRLLLRALGGVPGELRDTQCGFKLYRGEVARALFAECVTDGFMIDVELIRRARRRGLRVREFPVRWAADRDSRFSPWRGSLRNLRELARIRRVS